MTESSCFGYFFPGCWEHLPEGLGNDFELSTPTAPFSVSLPSFLLRMSPLLSHLGTSLASKIKPPLQCVSLGSRAGPPHFRNKW